MKLDKSYYINKIIADMTALGTYKKEFELTIDVLATMYLQYELYYSDWLDSGCKIVEEYTNKAGATNMRKTATYSALETLRKDIATYSNLLKLNPKSADIDLKNEKQLSRIASFMSGVKNGD